MIYKIYFMKTYELEILNKSREEFESVNLHDRLTNTAWKVFNGGTCEETVYFMDRGNLILTSDGITSQGTWCVYEESSLLHISYNSSKNGMMYRLAFIVGDILVFQLDYTNKYSIVLSRNNENLATIETFSELLTLLCSKLDLDTRNINIESDIDICYTANEKITDVYIPYGTKKLNNYSFKDCKNLTTVVLPETITELGEEVFSGCESLNEVEIPRGVSVIPKGSFKGCNNLKKIIIPDTVVEIGDESFWGCAQLSEVIIPEGLNTISKSLFEGCENLVNVVLPSTLTRIERAAFKNCHKIENISLSNNISIIETEVFYGCYNLKKVNLPSNIKVISESLFCKCNNIESIEIPETVTTIEDYAFAYCYKLQKIFIPKNVKCISRRVFVHCNNLKTVEVSEDNLIYDSRDSCNAIIESKTNSLKHGFVTTKIPYSVTKIKSYSFYYINVSHITFPDSILEIEHHALFNCSSLQSIIVPTTIKILANDFFANCNRFKLIIGIADVGWDVVSKVKEIENEMKSKNVEVITAFKKGLVKKLDRGGRGIGKYALKLNLVDRCEWRYSEHNGRAFYLIYAGFCALKLFEQGVECIKIVDNYMFWSVFDENEVYKVEIELIDKINKENGQIYQEKIYNVYMCG